MVGRTLYRALLFAAFGAAVAMPGCAGTYDMLTSQRFKDRPFHTLFTSEDPIQTLETSEIGDDRVRAMRDLKEPADQAQRERVLVMLRGSATTDRRALCRLAAVEALARFDDPRAGAVLIEAYRNAPFDAPQAGAKPSEVTTAASLVGIKSAVSTFTPETVTTIQCQVLEALGRHRSPESLRLLIDVASSTGATPAKSSNPVETIAVTPKFEPGSSESDRLDVRLAAIKSLGSYKSEPAAIRVLIAVLKSERDVAIRGRTHEALVSITGMDLPPNGQAWEEWISKTPRTR